MILKNLTTGEVVASQARRAERWLERTIGFLSRREIDRQDALWYPRCNSIHTVGMRVPIDVVFLDRRHRIVRLLCRVRQNRPWIMCRGASAVVELAPGVLETTDVLQGDLLEMQ